MAEEEDEDFEKLLAEKQHREFMGSIRSLVEVLKKLESSDAIVTNSIQRQSEKVSQLLDQIVSQPKPQLQIESPDIYLNQEIVVAAIKDLSQEFKGFTEAMKNKKPTEWEFKVERGYGNNIDKITAKPK